MTITDISINDKDIVTIDFVDKDKEATFFVVGTKLLEALRKVAKPGSSIAVCSD